MTYAYLKLEVILWKYNGMGKIDIRIFIPV